MLPSTGHLLISVTPDLATVDYISSIVSSNGNVMYSYTIEPSETVITHDLTTAVSPGNGGTINPAAGVHPYDEGTVVNITATPASGYAFDHWDGDCTGNGSCQVTMSGDRSVTAYFTVISSNILGDVDGNGNVDSFDALIILSGEVGFSIVQYCPINCGDVNGDGVVNSTDALIVLTYDVGITVPYSLGQVGVCPVNVEPCLGCNP
jgi:hypothetical protein